jgi:hypothetical protein
MTRRIAEYFISVAAFCLTLSVPLAVAQEQTAYCRWLLQRDC